MSVLPNYYLAYDEDCGPCTMFKRLVDFLDAYDRIEFLPLVAANERGLLDRVPEYLRFNSFHLIFPDGEIKSGSEALTDLIGLFPLGRQVSKMIILLPGGMPMTRFLYNSLCRLREVTSCHLRDKSSKIRN